MASDRAWMCVKPRCERPAQPLSNYCASHAPAAGLEELKEIGELHKRLRFARMLFAIGFIECFVAGAWLVARSFSWLPWVVLWIGGLIWLQGAIIGNVVIAQLQSLRGRKRDDV